MGDKKKSKVSWEERLYTVEFGNDVDYEKIKSFISSLLKEERERVIKEIKKKLLVVRKDVPWKDTHSTYNAYLRRQLSKLSKERK